MTVHPAPSLSAERPASTRLRLLLVEDNPIDRRVLLDVLTAAPLPYEVTTADTLEDARGHLAAARFDLLIVDHGLPDGTGFDLFKAAGDTPVIFVTNAGNVDLAVRALKAGAVDYLVKDPRGDYLHLLPHTLARALQERLTRNALRTAQAQMRDLLEFLPAAALAIDDRGRITFSNRRMAELWQHTPRIGDPAATFFSLIRLYHPDGRVAAPEECWSKLAACSAPICCELIVEATSATRVHTLAYANPLIDECGLIKGIVILWIDITERRRLESELGRTRRLEAIGTLAGGMAHEFNNLLASIMGNIQIAEMDLADAHPAKSSVHQAVASCRGARDLVARMLNFSRNSNPNQTTTALEPLLENTVQLLRLCLPKSVSIDLAIQPCPPVRCIPDELTQAILQLGINAGQALELRTGSVRFSLRHQPPGADVLARYPDVRPEHTIQITVADTGVGMNSATLERLFDPFFTTRAPGQGSGLGLPEVYGAMKRMRGTIVVESEAGTGTRVRLFLPPAGTPGSTPPIP